MAQRIKRKRRPAREVAEERVAVLRAKLESAQLTAALSYYASADKGRRNRDWRAPASSADLAIIPDAQTVLARARHTIANSWIGKAAVRAQKRNVAGRGIMTVPTAKDADGKELPEINRRAGDLWMRWASNRNACDVERRRSLWQIQRTVVSEEFVVGESLIVWSYQPNPNHVGLRLQMFEPEQFDLTIQSWDGHEVRGGVEVDEYGAAVAYHLYTKNPHDFLSSCGAYQSIRVPAERAFHYFDPERVLQTRGMSQMAPVLPDVRDFTSFKDATLWRARMEACIGFIIKKNMPTSSSGIAGIGPRADGDTGQTASGMRTMDIVPGMVPELMPGEDVEPFIPSSPGNQYDPFTTITLRGIGAGMGMSFGALTRHNDANYSAARQDMLEDEREIGPQQDLLIDTLVLPVYELWLRFAVLEGRLAIDADEFLADPDRFCDAEYVVPARPWIDPEKEANAYEKALKLRIMTRKEIVAMRGGRFQNLLKQMRDERTEAAAEGVRFPEDVEETEKLSKAEADAAKAKNDAASADATKHQIENPPALPAPTPAGDAPAPANAGAAAPASEPAGVNTEVNADSSLNGAQITAVLDVLGRLVAGQVTPDVAVELLVAVGIPRERAESMVKDQQKAEPPPPKPGVMGARRVPLAQADAPNYRPAADEAARCSTCSLAVGMHCSAYDFHFTPGSVCDAWEAEPIGPDSPDGRGKIMPGPRPEGTTPFERTSARDNV